MHLSLVEFRLVFLDIDSEHFIQFETAYLMRTVYLNWNRIFNTVYSNRRYQFRTFHFHSIAGKLGMSFRFKAV